jgi:AraC-like DNA-binding protein
MNNQANPMPIYYMAQIKEQLDYWQLDSEAWLSENKISHEQLLNFEETISYSTYESLITSAIELSKNDSLGLYVGERIGLTSHGMLGYAMLNSGTIREAIEIFQAFINTRTPFILIETIEASRTFSITFKEIKTLEKVRRTFLEALLVTFYNVLGQISFGTLAINSVSFKFSKPHYANKYSEFFDCPITFNQQQNEIKLPCDVLDTPLKLSNPASLRQARQLCELELAKMANENQNPSLAIRIKEMLITSAGNFPSLEKTAARLHMTPRTLHRHLKKEDSSYKLILENVTENIASEYLRSSSLTIQDISLLLGYIDVANFRRAFKRWTGMTPSEFRNKK